LRPVPGLEAKEQEYVKEKLKKYKDTLSRPEKKQVIKDAKELKEYQDEPSPQEELEKIPMLKREDIRREVEPLANEVLDVDGTTVLWQNIPTSGISYIRLLFDADDLPDELVPYMGILKQVLGFMDTENY